MISLKTIIDPKDRILLKRKLNKNGEAHRFLTNEIKRLSDPYVPMQTGQLKNVVDVQVNRIVYKAPYAKKQYTQNKGRGIRGKQWVSRMWADRGDEIVKSVAKFAGGKAK